MPLTGYGSDDDSRWHRLFMSLGHRTLILRYGANLGVILALFLPARSWQLYTVLTCASLSMMLGLGGGLYHDRRLCERCITSFLLNAPEIAAKRRWALRLAHRGKLLLTVMFGILGAGGVLAIVGYYELIAFSLVLLFAWLIFCFYITSTHQRFRPWCPWCQDDEGGDGHFDPVPNPDPQITAQPH